LSGEAVIATQTKYELTRDNYHRFVRVFTILALCPNHVSHSIPDLPFDVEEYIATRGLNQRNGHQGSPGGKILGLSYDEDYLNRASRKLGEGAVWTLERDAHGLELKHTI
jgi:hypothetical protein